MKNKQIKTDNNKKLLCAKGQTITMVVLSAISLLLMIIDVCIEFYYYSKNRGVEDPNKFPDWLNTMHIVFACIEIIFVVQILIYGSVTYKIYKKLNMINRSKLNIFICNWVFSSLYIVLSLVAVSRLNHLKNLEQAFIAGFACVPMVAIATICPIQYTTFCVNKK